MKTNINKTKAQKYKKVLSCISVLLIIVLLSEFALRFIWGFGKMPLYIESSKYEYMYAPNQEMLRFGHYFYTNSYSQRSSEPDSTKCIILGLGDSVINGGSQTDNDSLATNLVTAETDFQMLNISAGSWGPDNCAAYLDELGTFNAKAMFVLLSSHDFGDTMDFLPTVGIHESFPEEQYFCAIYEVWDRYVYPRLSSSSKKMDPDQRVLSGIDKGNVFNDGWNQLKIIADRAQIPLIIILHAEQSELRKGEYNDKGGAIVAWADANNVRLVKDITYLNEKHYRDNIHINNMGQRVIADIIKNEISLYLESDQ